MSSSLHILSLNTPNSFSLFTISTPKPSLSSVSFKFTHKSASISQFLSIPVLAPPPTTRSFAVLSEFAQEEEEELSSDGEGGERSFSPDLKLFVGNLPFTVDSASLAGLFERAGNVEMVEVIYDKMTGRSRGFAFVTMSSVEEAEAAAQQFNGYELEGRPLRVNAGPPPEKSESPFRGGSRNESPFRGGSRNESSFRGGSSSPRSNSSFDSSNRLYVGNLSWNVDDSALESLFSEQGKVLDAKVIYDRDSGRSKGFGFITYASADEVNNAVESLDGADLDGRSIRVSVAEARPPRRQF